MTELSKQAQDKIDVLRKEYISSLPDKLRQIEQSWEVVKQNPSHSDAVNNLALICHKFAGSAGAYGLVNFVSALLEIELVCKAHLRKELRSRSESIVSQLEPHYADLINIVNSEFCS